MKKIYLIFPIAILICLILPWFQLTQKKMAGYEYSVDKPSFSFSSYNKKNFQTQMEAWWNRNYGSRNTLYRFKNTIYDFYNFHQFHSGSDGNVLQGTQGVLFEQGYIISKFQNYDIKVMKKRVHNTVLKLDKLRRQLKELDIATVFIMAPSKADCREEYLPILWKFRAKHIPAPPSVYPIWEQELKKLNLLYVNGTTEIIKNNIKAASFPDSGTHWSLWGSAFTLVKALELLHEKDNRVPLLKIKKEAKTNIVRAEERDLASLIYIAPKYSRGSKFFSYAEFFPITHTYPCLLYGDSFTYQIMLNIYYAKLSLQDQAIRIANENPSFEQWSTALKKSKICFIVYTYPHLIDNNRIDNNLNKLIELTEIYISNKNNQ